MPETDASPILDVLRGAVPGATIDALPSVDMPTVVVDRDHALETFLVLRDHPALQFALLVDVIGVDRLPAAPRFEVVYHLVCLGAAYAIGQPAPARRLRLKVQAPGDDARVTSAVSVFPGANWLEREVFDLLGIVFEHHPDLRRILTPEDWTGFPLRKDYPVQIRKTTQSWEPIQLSVEEFAENIKRQRAIAEELARKPGPAGE
ncbi:MAG: NADH-quinone oxidoreductase subunit C [Acidobacteriota bacterium]